MDVRIGAAPANATAKMTNTVISMLTVVGLVVVPRYERVAPIRTHRQGSTSQTAVPADFDFIKELARAA